MSERFSKLYVSLKFRLYGAQMFEAMRALEIAKSIHTGFRKDGITPSFQHQIEIALNLFLLKDLDDLEGAIICAIFHDTDEDFPHQIPIGTLESFGSSRHATIRLLNKHTHDSFEDCLDALSLNMNGSIVKGEDRINNFQSMYRGNFPRHKVVKYRDDVVTLFLPMLKKARKKFPKQMDAYYSIENRLKMQVEWVNLLLKNTEIKGNENELKTV